MALEQGAVDVWDEGAGTWNRAEAPAVVIWEPGELISYRFVTSAEAARWEESQSVVDEEPPPWDPDAHCR